VQSAKLADGTPVEYFQEPWESGSASRCPSTLRGPARYAGGCRSRRFHAESGGGPGGVLSPEHGPLGNPVTGYLSRSTFDISHGAPQARQGDLPWAHSSRYGPPERRMTSGPDSACDRPSLSAPSPSATTKFTRHREIGPPAPLCRWSFIPCHQPSCHQGKISFCGDEQRRPLFQQTFWRLSYPIFRGRVSPVRLRQGFNDHHDSEH